jgi:ribokinase
LDWLVTDDGTKGPFPAGNALYSAVGAWLALSSPIIVARIGSDYPFDALDVVADRGLSISHVRRVNGNSFRVLLTEHPNGRDVRFMRGSGENLALAPTAAELPREAIAGVHVCPAKPDAQAALLDAARRRGCRTTLDLLFITDEVEPAPSEILRLLPSTDAFLPGLSEVRRLWPGVPPVEVLRLLMHSGCGTAVIKMGDAGCIAADGTGLYCMPAIPTRLVDATGAGDAFCGAFLAQWLETGDLATALAWGTAAASIIIQDYGVLHAVNLPARKVAANRSAQALKQIQCLRLL